MTLPLAELLFDRDLSAERAEEIRAIRAVTWPSITRARWVTHALAHEASCAALVANLRLLTARIRAEAPTPVAPWRMP